jgi:uncharacterized membrane-anchored protein
MKYRKNVYQSFTMIMQFGLNMIVPILLCTAAGAWLGKKFDLPILVVPLFLIGALAGFRNIYIMAKKIYEQESDRDTKDVKKTE